MVNGVIYFTDPKKWNCWQAVVLQKLKEKIIQQNHCGHMSGYFFTQFLYSAFAWSWWGKGMFSDVQGHYQNFLQCIFVSGAPKFHRPNLPPIPVQQAFKLLVLMLWTFPRQRGIQHVLAFQDFLPVEFNITDQKFLRVVRLFVKEVILMIRVPEALLSDKGAHL